METKRSKTILWGLVLIAAFSALSLGAEAFHAPLPILRAMPEAQRLSGGTYALSFTIQIS